MADNRPVGVLDSGVGGLTGVKVLEALGPEEDIVYFGDSKRAPYGDKTKEEIIEYTLQDVAFLCEHRIKALLIACNTITAYTLLPLQEAYPDMPVIGTIIPTAESAIRMSRNGQIAIIATQATVDSMAYDVELQKQHPETRILSMACPRLVPLIESGHIGPEDEELYRAAEEYLVPLREKNVDTLIMGCTHYPIIRAVIQKIMGETVTLIDSGGASAENVLRRLDEKGLRAEKGRRGVTKIFCSANRENFLTIAKAVLDRDIDRHLELI